MTLADLRKLSIKKHLQIHFRLRNGMECVITEHGVAQVPELRGVPDFNLEEELSAASEFLTEPAPPLNTKAPVRNAERPRKVTREELATMAAASPSGPVQPDHDDE